MIVKYQKNIIKIISQIIFSYNHKNNSVCFITSINLNRVNARNVKNRMKRQLSQSNTNDDRPVWDTVSVDNRYYADNQQNSNNNNWNPYFQQQSAVDVFFNGGNNGFNSNGISSSNRPQRVNNNNFNSNFNRPATNFNNVNNFNPERNQPAFNSNVINNNRPSQLPFTVNEPPRSFINCMRNCQTTSQYNPICGSDNMTYHNDQKLLCAQNCGASKDEN